jgi:ribonucleotide reductase beta subunit family protein with ferritin-like domain/glutaredoxin-related protein
MLLMGVTIYSKENCTLCAEAVNICNNIGLEYEKVYIQREDLVKIICKEFKTYPQVFVNGTYIGDFFEFEEYAGNVEPILLENPNRHTIFPLKHMNLWDLYKKAQMSNWTAEEIDLTSDMDDWKKLTNNERHFISYILAFFAASDGIVFENLSINFVREVQLPEARCFYAYQEHNEMVHGETYSKLIDKYITNQTEKDKMFRAIETIPCVKSKADWAMKWFDPKLPFSHRLVAFACVEGIFFSGSFCAIFWLKKRGLMPGLSFSNELISRDEGMHQEFAIELYHMLRNPCTKATVHAIIEDAVRIEKEFILDALPCKLIGMDSSKMKQYIEFVADRMLKQLRMPTVWNSTNPFDFMENISISGKSNFFEKRVGDYARTEGTVSDIAFEEDF